MMYSVMGVRGQPRTKPPRSVEEGLWKRPTVANNTETLANIRDIINQRRRVVRRHRHRKERRHQADDRPGPLKTVGLVEVPMGITLRHPDRRDLGRHAGRQQVSRASRPAVSRPDR